MYFYHFTINKSGDFKPGSLMHVVGNVVKLYSQLTVQYSDIKTKQLKL